MKKVLRWLVWFILLFLAVKSGSWVAIVAVAGTFIFGCVLKSLVPLTIAVGIMLILYVTGALNLVSTIL